MIDDCDPRMNIDYVRTVPGPTTRGDVVVTGVVHDHPASKYRVQSIINTVEPDILALELPPLAIPLFKQYAADDHSPPRTGGEMSAAIQAADTTRVVGIDGPTPAFLLRLIRTISTEEASLATIRTLIESLASVTKHAVSCRLAAAFETATAIRLPVVPTVDHESKWNDTPHRQANDERAQVRRATSVLNTFGPPTAMHFRDTAREAYMANRLSELREKGNVVAVVGMAHLDSVIEQLE